MLTLAEIPSFQKFSFSSPTAQMAGFMFQNVAYRATVYRTGVHTIENVSWGGCCQNSQNLVKVVCEWPKNKGLQVFAVFCELTNRHLPQIGKRVFKVNYLFQKS